MSEKMNGLTDEQNAVMMPYFVHEGEMSRLERMNKRWFIAFMIVLVMLIATNAGWIIYESQYDKMVITQDVDTGEGAAVISGTGDANYGENPSGNNGTSQESGTSGQPAEAVPDV